MSMTKSYKRFWPEKFITVIIPTLNEEENIDRVLETFEFEPTRKQLIIVDGGSIDKTVEKVRRFKRGSREYLNLKLVKSDGITGKGYQMIRGFEQSLGLNLVYLDADLDCHYGETADKIAEPLLSGEAFFVKSTFDRGKDWGRVTKLTAKPLLDVFYPDLNFIEQPLSGQVGMKKSLQQQLETPASYGVEISHLIQYYSLYGLSHITQVDLGKIDHRHRQLDDLALTAQEVAKTILYHAYKDGKIDMKMPLLEKLQRGGLEMC